MATMASRPTPTAPITVVPTSHTPPSARDLRAQTVQRLQAGMLGLAAMLLLVGLANIIMDRARQADEATTASPSAAATEAAPKNDPLADMGVVPSASATASTPPSRANARN